MTKIIVVEDDPMLGEIYQKKFEDAQFDVKLVTNGKMVVKEVAGFKPNLVLLDIVLPDMDGYEILEGLAKNEDTNRVPIYVFSNLSAKEDIDRAISLGAKGFLTKSDFTPSQLVGEIKKIMGHPIEEGVGTEARKTSSEQKNQKKNIDQVKNSNGKKILIIEDEDIFIEMFGEKLQKEGFEVIAAKNGKWGLKEAENDDFSCILLDMMMPAMNGYEAIQQLRSNEKTKGIPIIILSNSALDSEVKKAMDLGVNAYYVKTQVTPAELADRIKKLVK